MAKIADKHGLTNRYRENGNKRIVKRGRPRTKVFGTNRRKSCGAVSSQNISTTEMDKKAGLGCLFVAVIAVVIIFLIASTSNANKKSDEKTKLITLDTLCATNHPMLFDNHNTIKEYYKPFANFFVDFPGNNDNPDDAVLRVYKAHTNDNIREITINFSALSAEDKKRLTFEKVKEISLDYIPIDLILEYFVFDKAIQVNREGYTSYELYYKENIDAKKNISSEADGKLRGQHGFSIIIKEYDNGDYVVEIDTSWYDFAYNTNPTVGKPVSQEELASHQEWKFSLEEHID